MAATHNEVMRAIAAAVEAHGHRAALVPRLNGVERLKLCIDGVDLEYALTIRVEQIKDQGRFGGYSRKDHPEGKLRVIVRAYGQARQFPQKRDGSHSYDEIALALIGLTIDQARSEQFACTRRANEAIVSVLCTELGIRAYPHNGFRLEATETAAHPVTVTFRRNMTVEDVRQLHRQLTALGFLNARSPEPVPTD